MRINNANLTPSVFGCLGFVFGFILCRAVSPTELPTPAFLAEGGALPLEQANSGATASLSAPQERYFAQVINPTFPPSNMGTWDPLKGAAEQIAERTSPGAKK